MLLLVSRLPPLYWVRLPEDYLLQFEWSSCPPCDLSRTLRALASSLQVQVCSLFVVDSKMLAIWANIICTLSNRSPIFIAELDVNNILYLLYKLMGLLCVKFYGMFDIKYSASVSLLVYSLGSPRLAAVRTHESIVVFMAFANM